MAASLTRLTEIAPMHQIIGGMKFKSLSKTLCLAAGSEAMQEHNVVQAL
jgi:hypothetical protein